VVGIILGIYKCRVVIKIDKNEPERGKKMSWSRFR
jgi:hypothetical protein